MDVVEFKDGIAICGDCTCDDAHQAVKNLLGDDFKFPLIVADPPYGNIVSESWDSVNTSDVEFVKWMVSWTRFWSMMLHDNGAFYVWGGVGVPGFRPFFKYVPEVEIKNEFELANLITWSKKRGYGVRNNYLFTREELAYFTKGSAKKPRTFNVPYLDKIRGYDGYNKKYPAKDPRYRRTNVWTDITEMLSGKDHPTQKQQKLHEVIIDVHTNVGEYVLDPFGGAGTTAFAARSLNRKFVIFEQNREYFDSMVKRLQ